MCLAHIWIAWVRGANWNILCLWVHKSFSGPHSYHFQFFNLKKVQINLTFLEKMDKSLILAQNYVTKEAVWYLGKFMLSSNHKPDSSQEQNSEFTERKYEICLGRLMFLTGIKSKFKGFDVSPSLSLVSSLDNCCPTQNSLQSFSHPVLSYILISFRGSFL